MLKEVFDELLAKIISAAQVIYGDRLVLVVLYGSVARGILRQDSGVHLLILGSSIRKIESGQGG